MAMTYDDVKDNLMFTRKQGIGYPILSDAGSKYIREFGILNESMDPESRYFGVPHPGIFIVDRHGKIFAKLAEEDYKKRPAIELVLETVDAMQKAESN